MVCAVVEWQVLGAGLQAAVIKLQIDASERETLESIKDHFVPAFPESDAPLRVRVQEMSSSI
jgi:hypothetical protein